MTDTIQARAAAFSALQPLGNEGATLPVDIQWMPPGPQRFTLQDHPGREFELDVTPAVAAKADQLLQEMRARAAAGQGSLPYADKNHEDSEATFEPVRFFWGGDDAKTGGVRVEVRWSGYGESLVKARAFRYFSPSFVFDAARKTFLGIARNIGGLVNDPGFSTIQAFARGASRTGKEASSANPQQTQNPMTPEEKQQLDELKSSVMKLTETVTGLANTVQAQAKAAPAADPTIAELKAKVAKLEAHEEARATEAKEATKAHAKACVEKAVKSGRLSPQDTTSQTFWVDLITANAKAADELEKLPVNPVFVQIVQANARSGAAAATGTAAEQFVALVHAKAGQGKKPGEEHLNAAIAEKPDLYQAWRAANGQPGL